MGVCFHCVGSGIIPMVIGLSPTCTVSVGWPITRCMIGWLGHSGPGLGNRIDT